MHPTKTMETKMTHDQLCEAVRLIHQVLRGSQGLGRDEDAFNAFSNLDDLVEKTTTCCDKHNDDCGNTDLADDNGTPYCCMDCPS